ncbi:MAG: type I-E CRISPR-associated protein Cas7/Cse4/CasC, partial [Rhodococcus sp. (in: high G+C Gram-positive bacteria)]
MPDQRLRVQQLPVRILHTLHPSIVPPTSRTIRTTRRLFSGLLEALTELAETIHRSDGERLEKRRVKDIIKADNNIDVALVGRMVADDAELNVDAAVQVAHALSVQAVEQEFDYFTAVDDFQESKQEIGAGMIGTIEFNSSTLYRYATINVSGLADNLGDPGVTAKAAATFVESFVLSMPTGKLNTFANNTVPDAVLICVRADQPINLVSAFEDAIEPGAELGAVSLASRRLAQRETDIEVFSLGACEVGVTGVSGVS